MRTLIIATALVACGITETTETEGTTTETVQTENVENTETTFAPPVDVVDEEVKRLQELENTNFDGETENFTTEDNNVNEVD